MSAVLTVDQPVGDCQKGGETEVIKPRAATLKDASAQLGIAYSTAKYLASRGEFPCKVFKVGKSWRVPIDSLEDLLRAH